MEILTVLAFVFFLIQVSLMVFVISRSHGELKKVRKETRERLSIYDYKIDTNDMTNKLLIYFMANNKNIDFPEFAFVKKTINTNFATFMAIYEADLWKEAVEDFADFYGSDKTEREAIKMRLEIFPVLSQEFYFDIEQSPEKIKKILCAMDDPKMNELIEVFEERETEWKLKKLFNKEA